MKITIEIYLSEGYAKDLEHYANREDFNTKTFLDDKMDNLMAKVDIHPELIHIKVES
jgi:hypothetical protein